MKYKNKVRRTNYPNLLLLVTLLTGISWYCQGPGIATKNEGRLALKNDQMALSWEKTSTGWQLKQAQVKKADAWVSAGVPSGEYTFLYSPTRPDSIPVTFYKTNLGTELPGAAYKYITSTWLQATNPVAMNTAGEAFRFFPSGAVSNQENKAAFTHETAAAAIKSEWCLDEKFTSDIIVQLTLTARKDGYYSVATPSLTTLSEKELAWGMLPGYFQGKEIQKDFVLAYAYGQGIPNKPVVVRERTASTLAPLLSSTGDVTLAVIPDPGVGRDPWSKGHNTHADWQLGLSLMNRQAQLSPTVYHPVLGQKGSWLKKGQQITYGFRYTLQAADWFTVYKHAIYDVYRFADFLSLKQTQQSLTDRLLALHRYVIDDKTSMWNKEKFEGLQIGAQLYLGGVVGADKDAIKNSDYGAMWMLATITQDPVLQKTRLPFARNFKLKQQENKPGFFQGAAIGQYYLTKSKRFTEEWGSHVEPISLTYYTMLDMGNILLFQPDDTELRERLRLGAERLLAWQKPAGNWQLAYDRDSNKSVYADLADLRPTFYDLLVAYRILRDKKYLEAAVRGADWFVQQAVQKAHFVGVCGDVRFVNDFATGQSAQALLNLYELTQESRFREAAIEAARIYTGSIYTHPIPTREIKLVKGAKRQDWQISQVGLSFEHGGTIGSATGAGPIPLASHAGLFLRISQLTGDSLYRDMARAAALGCDAFVNPQTSIASYYWHNMDAGAGRFPHHAWWQVGWITDYLLSEASLRSDNKIMFSRGFITPKVGPQQTYGFAPGQIYNDKAQLILKAGLVNPGNANVDYISALATNKNRLYVAFLNNQTTALTIRPQLYASRLFQNKKAHWTAMALLTPDGNLQPVASLNQNNSISIPGFGLTMLALDFETSNQ